MNSFRALNISFIFLDTKIQDFQMANINFKMSLQRSQSTVFVYLSLS
jgi:hypothetical protein